MRPKERREAGEQDLFRARLDQIIDLDMRWCGSRGTILKHSYNLSDEALCERWVENPYFQCFCGEDFFQHRLVFDLGALELVRMGETLMLDQRQLARKRRTSRGTSRRSINSERTPLPMFTDKDGRQRSKRRASARHHCVSQDADALSRGASLGDDAAAGWHELAAAGTTPSKASWLGFA